VTVTGAVDPRSLGVTLTHEHIFVDLSQKYEHPEDQDIASELEGPVAIEMLGHLRMRYKWNRDNLILRDPKESLAELARFRRMGGGTVCDLSSRGIRIDALLLQLRRLSKALGLHIIVGTGYYVAPHHDSFAAAATIDQLAQLFVREIEVGMGHERVRAGILGEIGLSQPPKEVEIRVLRAAARAHLLTGAPIVVHQRDYEHYRVPHAALDILAEEGVVSNRVVIGHSGDAQDLSSVRAAAERGAYIAYDFFGIPGYDPESNRQLPQEREYVDGVLCLVMEGFITRVLLSHDICTKAHLHRYGGHGYDHLQRWVKPMLLKAGLTEDDFDTIMVRNPARLLALGR
jgi:phosphotriesterase-related protein